VNIKGLDGKLIGDRGDSGIAGLGVIIDFD
jgi:hypothetical protein